MTDNLPSFSDGFRVVGASRFTEFEQGVPVGMRSWYPARRILPSMTIRGSAYMTDATGDTPCLMRGARFVMVSSMGDGSWFAVELVMRYVRMLRLTFLDVGEWLDFLSGTINRPGPGVLAERRDCARYGRKVFQRLSAMVTVHRFSDGGVAIIDGRRVEISDWEQSRLIRKMHSRLRDIDRIASSIRQINDRRANSEPESGKSTGAGIVPAMHVGVATDRRSPFNQETP